MSSVITSTISRSPRLRGIVAAFAAAMMCSACASGGLEGLNTTASLGGNPTSSQPREPGAAAPSDLDRAINYWGKAHLKDPTDANAALAYAKNLKAKGRKKEAMNVLRQASVLHGNNRKLASEYGRLVLEFGQVNLAERLLAFADDPTEPDWRVISARGTVFAKKGKFDEAIQLFERARQLAPQRASIANNLALAHAANGQPAKAETILRSVASKDADPKVRQNLALVMSLQGKYDEAKRVAAVDLPKETAVANVDFLQKMVRVKPQYSPAPAPVYAGKTPAPAATPAMRPVSAPTAVAKSSDGWNTKVAQNR